MYYINMKNLNKKTSDFADFHHLYLISQTILKLPKHSKHHDQ